MKIKLMLSTVWTVHPNDEETAQSLLERQPADVIHDYIEDAVHNTEEMTLPLARAVRLYE